MIHKRIKYDLERASEALRSAAHGFGQTEWNSSEDRFLRQLIRLRASVQRLESRFSRLHQASKKAVRE